MLAGPYHTRVAQKKAYYCSQIWPVHGSCKVMFRTGLLLVLGARDVAQRQALWHPGFIICHGAASRSSALWHVLSVASDTNNVPSNSSWGWTINISSTTGGMMLPPRYPWFDLSRLLSLQVDWRSGLAESLASCTSSMDRTISLTMRRYWKNFLDPSQPLSGLDPRLTMRLS